MSTALSLVPTVTTSIRQWFHQKLSSPGGQTVARSIGALLYPRAAFWGLADNMSFENAVGDGYKSITWVYRCISAYATAIASVPWRVYSVDEAGTETYLNNHPLADLLNKPNPFFGRREFFETLTAHLFLAGAAYIEKVYVQGKPYQLWNMRPDWVTPNRDSMKFIDGWVFKPPMASKGVDYATNDLVQFRFIDPLDVYGYQSPLTAAGRTIHTENSAIGWNKSLLDNSAVPGGIFKIPVQNTTKEQRDELKLAIQDDYAGDNRFQTMILWGGIEWTKMGLAPADMQFAEQRLSNKYEVCALFGVPPAVVGANEDPTYANYGVARLSWWEDAVLPLLEWYKNKMDQSIAPAFGPNIRVHYDLTRVPAMREAFAQQVKTAYTLWQMSFPINAINKRVGLGMEEVPWGDTAYLQVNMAPIDQLGKLNVGLDTTPATPSPDDGTVDDDTTEENVTA